MRILSRVNPDQLHKIAFVVSCEVDSEDKASGKLYIGKE